MDKMVVEQVSYSYISKYQTILALREVNCSFESGMFYAITGESGSGKSTLLSLLAGLDLPKEGKIYLNGEDLSKMDRDIYRRDIAAVVYQAFHLFPLLNALENVMYPLELKGIPKARATARAKKCIGQVGLPEKIHGQFPKMMSGGEQQRVAIARAMAAGGKLLFADEPTGNLDTENEENVVAILERLAHEDGYMVVVVTHNPGIAARADVEYRMRDGQIVEEQKRGGGQ